MIFRRGGSGVARSGAACVAQCRDAAASGEMYEAQRRPFGGVL